MIHANGIDIEIYTEDFQNEYISITDIARYKSDNPTAVIQNWMRNRDVIEFLGLWEILHNLNFNPSNSRGLKIKLEQMHLLCLQRNGLIQQMTTISSLELDKLPGIEDLPTPEKSIQQIEKLR